MDPKSSSNGDLGDPWAARRRLWHPPWSIWRGPKNESILKGSLDRQKSMRIGLWTARGAKRAPRQVDDGGLFGQLVPRAGLARAFSKVKKKKGRSEYQKKGEKEEKRNRIL